MILGYIIEIIISYLIHFLMFELEAELLSLFFFFFCILKVLLKRFKIFYFFICFKLFFL